MASAHEIASDLLRTFAQNVVARRPPWTYGQYATALGKDPRDYGLAVGMAMHAIGAICVVRQLPVAPLFWVRRADNQDAGIFESDSLERKFVIEGGNYDTMYVVAREYRYDESEFDKLHQALEKSLASGKVNEWSPHGIWHLTFAKKPKDSNLTYFERAMARYRALFEEMKRQRDTK
jgi:hypothetical protein